MSRRMQCVESTILETSSAKEAESSGVLSVNSLQVPMSSVSVPEYYIGEIPPEFKPLYALLGVKYVRVKKGSTEYLIFADVLGKVVTKLGLFD